jgi:hypothetical protein
MVEEDLFEVAAHGWGVDLASKPPTLNRQTRSINGIEENGNTVRWLA